ILLSPLPCFELSTDRQNACAPAAPTGPPGGAADTQEYEMTDRLTPPKPGLLRTCPHCRRWFALRLLRGWLSPTGRRTRAFACRFCGREVAFTDLKPLVGAP